MALADYVCREAVCTDLRPADREEAIRAVLERFVAGKALPKELVEPVFQSVLKREKLGSTAIGKGVAVPHTRLDQLHGILVGFAHCPDGVEFHALDGEPVYEIFLIVASGDSRQEYISVMERITRLVQNDDFRRFVAQADGRDAVIDLIKEMDR